MKSWCKEFDDPYTTRLYMALVWPTLEYVSIIGVSRHLDAIESVQRHFLFFALRDLRRDFDRTRPPYERRLKLIDFLTLEKRREYLGVSCMTILIWGDICCSQLISKIPFNTSSRYTRYHVSIRFLQCHSNYDLHINFRILCKMYNNYYHFSDVGKA